MTAQDQTRPRDNAIRRYVDSEPALILETGGPGGYEVNEQCVSRPQMLRSRG
jgi:hypothetical protein